MTPVTDAENVPNQQEASGGETRAESKDASLPERAGAGNIDNIRDILFGSHMRDYDRRFARLEENLLKESGDLRENMRRRFDTLEAYIKKELEMLQVRLKNEREERSGAVGQQSRELKELAESLANRLRDLVDRGLDVERDLRQQILQQAKDLMDEIGSKHEQIALLLERRFQELRHAKTDRAALANLLTEVALRLNDQFHIPGSEK
jgi:hypothetical protein